MANRKRRWRARQGTGTVVSRSGRFMAQADLRVRPDGSRDRRTRSFASRERAEE